MSRSLFDRLDLNITLFLNRLMAKFNAKLVKWGNSVGVSIPKPIRDSLNLEAGDDVQIHDIDNSIVITKENLEQARQALQEHRKKQERKVF